MIAAQKTKNRKRLNLPNTRNHLGIRYNLFSRHILNGTINNFVTSIILQSFLIAFIERI
jgi:hypothetical protein